MRRLRAGWDGGWRIGTVLTALALLMIPAAPRLATPAAAQDKLVPPSKEAVLFSFAAIVKRTAPAVVNVYVREKTRSFVSPYYDEYRRYYSDMPQDRMQKSLGSGVIVNETGSIYWEKRSSAYAVVSWPYRLRTTLFAQYSFTDRRPPREQ